MGRVNKAKGKKASPAKGKVAQKKKVMKKTAKPKPALKSMKKSPNKQTPTKTMKKPTPPKPIKQTNVKTIKEKAPAPTDKPSVKKNLDDNLILKGIKALRELIEKKFDRIHLQVNIANAPTSQKPSAYHPLPHTLVVDESKICLIITDVKDDEKKSINHYKNSLKGKVKVDKIMTFKQFIKEHKEAGKKHCSEFDYVLADLKIYSKVRRKFPKQFMRRRPVLSVNFKANAVESVQKALSKAEIPVNTKGRTFVINVAHSEMTDKQILDNVKEAFKGLNANLPGGSENIRSLLLKTGLSKAIPVYSAIKEKVKQSVKAQPKTKSKPKNGKKTKGESESNSDGEDEDNMESENEELEGDSNEESGDVDNDDESDDEDESTPSNGDTEMNDLNSGSEDEEMDDLNDSEED